MSDDSELAWPYNLPWPEGVEPTYESIAAFAARHGVSRADLLAMAEDTDGFYAARESRRRDAAWFTWCWQHYGFAEHWESTGRQVHVRHIFYRLTQQVQPPALPRRLAEGQTVMQYDDDSWKFLVAASRDARYLDMVPPEAIQDNKNPAVIGWAKWARYSPDITVEADEWDLSLPPFPDAPSLSLGFCADGGDGTRDDRQRALYSKGLQRYHMESWFEKSTMDDVLRAPSSRYAVNQQAGQGEFSLTKVRELCERVLQAGRPAIIWYGSDLDPGGKSMPVAFSRKLEYMVRHDPRYHDLDITVIPLTLLAEQVEHYGLPRAPIKPKERRGAQFTERHGEGCELDAMEALFPGELARLAEQAFGHFFDASLEERCDAVEADLRADMEEAEDAVAQDFRERYDALGAEYDVLRAEFEQRLEDLNERRSALFAEWSDALEEAMPDARALMYERPEADEQDPEALWVTLPAVKGKPARTLRLPVLFHSRWSYMRCLAAYHAFQRREPPQRQRGDNTRFAVLALKAAHPDWSSSRISAALGGKVQPRQVSRILQAARDDGGT